MHKFAKLFFLAAASFVCLHGCHKKNQDVSDHIPGEWNCSGKNHVHRFTYDSVTNTTTLNDTDIVINNYIIKITKDNDTSMKVICMGYWGSGYPGNNMSYGDMGGFLKKSHGPITNDCVEYEYTQVNSSFGYGIRRRLSYYFKADSIVFFSNWFDGDVSYIELSGRKK